MPTIKNKVKKRDDNTCQKCSYKPSKSKSVHAHHIVPKSCGGEDTMGNLITLCSKCHDFASKPKTLIEDYALFNAIYISTGMRPE